MIDRFSHVRAVILDLDGTLINSVEDLADAVNSMLSEAGLPTHPLEAFNLFIGDGMDMLVRRALPPESSADPDFFAEAVQSAKREYGQRWQVKTRPYPGADALLAGLSERGLATCILSNKPDEFTQTIMRTMFPGHSFTLVRGAREGVPKKPHPAAALEMSAALRLSPGDILVMGDSEMDIQTAKAAGMASAGALWGFRSREELANAGADILLDRPQDLLTHLDGQG